MGTGVYSSVGEMRKAFNERRAALRFFDANAWVGPASEPVIKRVENIVEIESILHASFVSEALVTHFASLNYDFDEGNKLLLKMIENHDGLYAAITLVPSITEEFGTIGDYIDKAIARKARAVRLFPKQHSFVLDEWCSGPIFEAMIERGMPLIIWHSESTWSEIRSICLRYPELNIIVEGNGRKILYDNRMFYQLLGDHPNLYMEIHNLTNYLAIEDISKRFGPQKLVFGSYFPIHEPGAAMMLVTHSRIPEEHKKLIAGDNLRALIGGVV